MNLLKLIPQLDTKDCQKASIGFSGDEVYIVKGGYENNDVVVKISKRIEVMHEAQALIWLKQHTLVPTVYKWGRVEDYYYCIMECLKGVMYQEAFRELGVNEWIIQYALLVKSFHEIDYSNVPNHQVLRTKLSKIRKNINKVNPTHFEREYRNFSAIELFNKLKTIHLEDSDLVLCHGDMCMPNIIWGNGLIGFIDVSGMGINDRYLDLAIALRTLRYNLELNGLECEEKYIDLFIQTYGINKLDQKKLEYYTILDELMVG